MTQQFPGNQPAGGHYPSGPSVHQPQRKRSKAPLVFAMTAVLVVMLAIVAVFAIASRTDAAAASEVFLQSSTEVGPDPFTPPVATTPARPGTTSTTRFATPPASPGSQRTYNGNQPGLYGGTRDIGSCDPEKMLDFLDANPDKKAAWAGVQGIPTSEVRTYVSTLTSVVLRTDTYVTNHGFVNGQATTISTVLEAGTAVMVDKYGVPRVKCFCGNPLTPARRYTGTVYRGSRWTGFDPATIVIIQSTTVVINEFVIIDTNTGQPIARPAGTNGGGDKDGPGIAQPDPATPDTAPDTTSTTIIIDDFPPETAVPPTPPPTVTVPPTTPHSIPSPPMTVHAPTPPPTYPPQTAPPSTQPAAPDVVSANGFAIDKLRACHIDLAGEGIDSTGDPFVFVISGTEFGPKQERVTFQLDMRTGVMTPQSARAQQLAANCPGLGSPTHTGY